MYRTLIRLLSIFIPVKSWRKAFRQRFLTDKKSISQEKHIRYIEGENNTLICPEGFKLNCVIYGNGNKVLIDENDLSSNTQLDVYIGVPEVPANNCVLKIGKSFSSNSTMIRICEDNTEVIIGDDCLFSADIQIWASDTHTITDMSGKCINIGKFVHIGNHVWLGYGATVMKNTAIPDDCIVGCQATVCGKFDVPNSVIAGNPAKICKTDVKWNRKRPQEYINNQGVD